MVLVLQLLQPPNTGLAVYKVMGCALKLYTTGIQRMPVESRPKVYSTTGPLH